MAGLDPAIHASPRAPKTWMPGTSPGMTEIVTSFDQTNYDSRMSSSLRPSLLFNSFFTALDATTSPSLA